MNAALLYSLEFIMFELALIALFLVGYLAGKQERLP